MASTSIATPHADNLRGSLLMILAMALFAVEDSLLKATAMHVPVGEVLVIFGIGGTALFALMAHRRGDAIMPRGFLSRVILVRSGFEIFGRVFYTLAFALTSLSTTSAILQATPLVVAAGGMVVFRERVSVLRWALILLGFVGVLIVLRPGPGSFSPLSLLAVAGMIGFAGRDLATRAAPPVLTNAQLGIAGFAMLVVAGGLLLIWRGGIVVPSPREATALALAVMVGVGAYASLTASMRLGELSAVTPFRYSRLLFGMGLGIAVFGERPDSLEYLGAGVIVLTGIALIVTSRAR